jgi:predicted nucleic acid-binding protein
MQITIEIPENIDIMIAATAKIHQLTLVTRDVRDFDSCSIPLLNPFT